MTGFIAPVSLDEMYIVESEFHIKSEPVTGDLSVSLSISETEPEMFHDRESSRYVYRGGLLVGVAARRDGTEEEKMDARVMVRGKLSVTDEIGTDDDAREYLRLNLVSMFYACARSDIMAHSSQSPMRQFIIAPIDPTAFIEIAEEGQKGEGDAS